PWRAAKGVLSVSLRHAEVWLGGASATPSEGSLGAMAETWLGTAEVSTSGRSLGATYTRSMSAKSPLLTRRERKAAVAVDTHPVLEAMDGVTHQWTTIRERMRNHSPQRSLSRSLDDTEEPPVNELGDKLLRQRLRRLKRSVFGVEVGGDILERIN
ncbi:hypothetical protein SARC_14470, partial [Sphaeroforma arctica JP610]